jgi:hypothetical protein
MGLGELCGLALMMKYVGERQRLDEGKSTCSYKLVL